MRQVVANSLVYSRQTERWAVCYQGAVLAQGQKREGGEGRARRVEREVREDSRRIEHEVHQSENKKERTRVQHARSEQPKTVGKKETEKRLKTK